MSTLYKVFRRAGIAVVFVAGTITAFSQWSHDPSLNTPVSTAPNSRNYPVCTTDDSGGAIITWLDSRSGVGHIYAQRISHTGVTRWTHDGVAICTAANGQLTPTIVSDNQGGAIITWPDYRSGTNYDIYAQRVNSAGAVQWTANGVAICTASGDQFSQVVTSDDSGGAIITWTDTRNGNDDIFAQRINGSGTVQWTADGIPVCTIVNTQTAPQIIRDGSGGAVVVWQDLRNTIDWDLYAQRISNAGAAQWTTNGVPVCTVAFDQINPMLASDDSGGTICTWQDYRSNTTYHIYAQRLNGSGTAQWASNGIPVCMALNGQQNPTIARDNAGGAIITWEDIRNGTNYEIYAQRITGAGSPQWVGDGIAITSVGSDQLVPVISADGSGGAVITWMGYRGGPDVNIYSQRINNDGSARWSTNGVAVCTAPNNQINQAAVGDGTGGAIITWADPRTGNYNIFAQRVDNIGYLGWNNPHISFVRDVPADQGGKVNLSFDASSYDQYPYQFVTSYSVWRGVSAPVDVPSNVSGVFKNSSGKTYRRITNATGSTYWEMVGSVGSHYLLNYNLTAPTQNDSDPTGTHVTKFFVSAQTWDPFTFWDSNVDSGYSVDNLPPAPVQAVSAQPQTASVLVHWSPDLADSDVGSYEVHRSTTSLFTPGPSTKIGQTQDTLLVDASPVGNAVNYYRIITVDIHGNKSTPSPQAAAGTQSTQVYPLNDKWNMISVPLVVGNFSKTFLYPTATSPAFAYQGSYVPEPTLANGTGYWLYFNGSQSVSMTGFLLGLDTVHVNTGWNMIGSVSSSVPVSNITSIPGGLVTSPFFGFNGSYVVSSTIDPGKAYWVKVTQPGILILSSAAQSADGGIVIQPVSELPPPPPDASISDLAGIPARFALDQNYPNPFNPSTLIRYQLSQSGWVTLKVYDMLGREVTTLVNEYQEAGYKSVTASMNALPSGMYVYRITSGSFTDMKKMILLK